MASMPYLVAALFGAIILAALTKFLVDLLRFRGTRVITCPETKSAAGVRLAAGRAATSGFIGAPKLRLEDCTRWPERRNCGQECLRQIEAAPDACLMRNLLAGWYESKSCVFCKRPFAPVEWTEHQPLLLAPDDRIVGWSELRPETLPDTFATHQPVCFSCGVAEAFRREHADLVTDRERSDLRAM
jgi:hypothetical protein